MHSRVASDDCPIANLNLACQRHTIDDHAVATNLAVVSHVSVCHNQVVATYDRLTLSRRTTIDRSTLAHHVIIAQLGSRILALEFQILRDTGNHRTRMNIATLAQTRTVLQHCTRTNVAIVAYNNICCNVCKGINRYVCTDLGVGMNVRHRADQRVFHNRMKVYIFRYLFYLFLAICAIIVASVARWPPTNALASIITIPRRTGSVSRNSNCNVSPGTTLRLNRTPSIFIK